MSNLFDITGDKELVDMFNNLGERHTRNLSRAAVQGVAQQIAKQAKKNAPKNTGTLRKAIKARRKKSHPRRPASVVFVEHGGNVKNDAFYWRFLEYGTKSGIPEHRFIGRAAKNIKGDFKNIFRKEFGLKLEKALAREAKRNAKK